MKYAVGSPHGIGRGSLRDPFINHQINWLSKIRIQMVDEIVEPRNEVWGVDGHPDGRVDDSSNLIVFVSVGDKASSNFNAQWNPLKNPIGFIWLYHLVVTLHQSGVTQCIRSDT
uniref:Uncharacterized protein n=1 Tax=Cucumis melo TaxID=3656 RepID=A0A9I9EIT5_CUCME